MIHERCPGGLARHQVQNHIAAVAVRPYLEPRIALVHIDETTVGISTCQISDSNDLRLPAASRGPPVFQQTRQVHGGSSERGQRMRRGSSMLQGAHCRKLFGAVNRFELEAFLADHQQVRQPQPEGRDF